MLRENIRKLLAKYGQTQSDLAQILGITYQSISIKLNGKSSFTLNEIIRIVQVYGLSAEEVYDIFIKDSI
jgi:plasmid maintenance system antidote protein VapI